MPRAMSPAKSRTSTTPTSSRCRIRRIAATLAASGAFTASAHAKLPAPPAKSDAEKKADADKAAATKAKEGDLLSRAQEKAVANYKKTKGMSMAPSKPAKPGKK